MSDPVAERVTPQFTPGPWKAAKGTLNAAVNGAWGDVEECAVGSDGFSVCTVWADVEELAERAEANARLIAAAPELLAALKAVEFRGHGMDRCPMCAGWNASPNGETPYRHSKDCQLAAALQKATGAPALQGTTK